MLLGISRLDEKLLASQERLCCMELFKSYSVTGHNRSQVPAKCHPNYKQRHRIA